MAAKKKSISKKTARKADIYWSEAAKEKKDPSGVFYYWKGERPMHPNAPQLEGTGEIRIGRPIAPPDTSQLVRTLTLRSTHGRPVFTCAPIPTT